MSTSMHSIAIAPDTLPAVIHTIALDLTVSDPEVIADLQKCSPGADRERYALSGLRLGVPRSQASSRRNGCLCRHGCRPKDRTRSRESLSRTRRRNHRRGPTSALRQFFDPASGELPRRLESLLKQDGDLERFLRQHVGPDSSTLAKTLDQHLDPLLQLLDPDEAEGLKMRIESMLHEVLDDQRTCIVREFSLDNDESALSRLLRKVTRTTVNSRAT